MKVEYKTKGRKLYNKGNESLVYRIEFFQIEGFDTINSFYASLVEECEGYCLGELFDFACRHSRADRYAYLFSIRVTHCDDALVSVLIAAKLRCKGGLISQYARAHTWDLRDSQLLPSQYICKRIGVKMDKGVKAGELLLCEGRPVDIKNADIDGILSEYKGKFAFELQ